MAAKPSAEATDGDVPELPRNKAVLGPWLQVLLCSRESGIEPQVGTRSQHRGQTSPGDPALTVTGESLEVSRFFFLVVSEVVSQPGQHLGQPPEQPLGFQAAHNDWLLLAMA